MSDKQELDAVLLRRPAKLSEERQASKSPPLVVYKELEGKIKQAAKLLESAYGIPARNPPPLGNKEDPLEELIFIILTLKTNESNFQRVYDDLKHAFPTWESVLNADLRKLKEAIRTGGLSNQKAPRIKAILQSIWQATGQLNLDFLKNLPDSAVEEYLDSLPGIGKKAARCVMAYSLGREAFPVDTHTFRVCRRLGFIVPDVSAKRAMDILQDMIPKGLRYDLHVNMVIHGRIVCTSQGPKCPSCVLNNICASYRSGVFVEPPEPPGTNRKRQAAS